MTLNSSQLHWPDQVCFPMYASSRMITRLYKPLLDKFDLTYPQYLVLLILWHDEKLTMSELGQKLFLNTNTLTPLVKKMKDKDLLSRKRSREDERTVYVQLTNKGRSLKDAAKSVPTELLASLNMTVEEIETIRKIMWKFLENFVPKPEDIK